MATERRTANWISASRSAEEKEATELQRAGWGSRRYFTSDYSKIEGIVGAEVPSEVIP